MYPLLVYLWLFGIGELMVVFFFLDRLLYHLLTWPYLIGLLALVGSWLISVAAQATGQADWASWRVAGPFVPTWAKAFGALVGLFVLFLAVGTLLAGPNGAIATGAVFPENMGLFSIRAFSAFLFAVAGSIGSVLLARSIEPFVAIGWAGLYLVVPITLAALLNIGLFSLDRPGGVLYILAYVVVGAVIAWGLWTFRARPSSVVGRRLPLE